MTGQGPAGGRGRGKPFYTSVVLPGERLDAVRRSRGTYVLAAKPQFEQLPHNRLPADESDFHGSPAVSQGPGLPPLQPVPLLRPGALKGTSALGQPGGAAH